LQTLLKIYKFGHKITIKIISEVFWWICQKYIVLSSIWLRVAHSCTIWIYQLVMKCWDWVVRVLIRQTCYTKFSHLLISFYQTDKTNCTNWLIRLSASQINTTIWLKHAIYNNSGSCQNNAWLIYNLSMKLQLMSIMKDPLFLLFLVISQIYSVQLEMLMIHVLFCGIYLINLKIDGTYIFMNT